MASQTSFLFGIIVSLSALALSSCTEFFEITKPVTEYRGSRRSCTVQLLTDHLFDTPFYSAVYTPPAACGNDWRLATLTWSGRVSALQPSRIGRVSFDGLHVLKTVTPIGPDASSWTFDAVITRYASYLRSQRILTVTLQDDAIYNGNLYLNLTLTVYRGSRSRQFADRIVPLYSQTSPDFSPFNLSFSAPVDAAVLSNLPRNTYRAEVEISQIEGGAEAGYWSNVDDSYLDIIPANLRKFTGGGVFRETLVYIDELLAGATWQYPVLNPNYINPNWFSPAVGIGSFVVPTYRVDLTPFVGRLTDGNNHTISFGVTNILSGGFWEVSGALHLWLDVRSRQTRGTVGLRVISDSVSPSVNFTAGNSYQALVTTTAERSSNITARIQTSFGYLTVLSSTTRYLYNYNEQKYDERSAYTRHFIGGTNTLRVTYADGSNFFSSQESFYFPLVFQGAAKYVGSTAVLDSGFVHAFNFNKTTYRGNYDYFYETLVNEQAEVQQLNTTNGAQSSYGVLKQNYNYTSNYKGCYQRSFSITNGEEATDAEDFNCV